MEKTTVTKHNNPQSDFYFYFLNYLLIIEPSYWLKFEAFFQFNKARDTTFSQQIHNNTVRYQAVSGK